MPMADDDYRRQLQGAMESATRDPFVQFLEKERAAGREYGDSPEFLKAVREGRMKPYPGAAPGMTSIDGIAPPPMDWDKLIKSIPPDIYMQQRAQAPGGAADFVPPQGLTPNMHEAVLDNARNGAPPAPPPQALRGEMMTDSPFGPPRGGASDMPGPPPSMAPGFGAGPASINQPGAFPAPGPGRAGAIDWLRGLFGG